MERILFIDACLRGPELSRTYGLCQRFLAEYTAQRPQTEVIHRDLRKGEFPLLDGERAAQRGDWLRTQPDHPLLQPAREVAGADLILVGAPYWDLSFPAALKAYLEWSSCLGVTFRYTEDGQLVGLSRAKALVYCTTAGGPVEGQNFGYHYIKALAAMFGIRNTYCVAAEGLDIRGSDVNAILDKAKADAAGLVKAVQTVLDV